MLYSLPAIGESSFLEPIAWYVAFSVTQPVEAQGDKEMLNLRLLPEILT